jgi:hypothetical protein
MARGILPSMLRCIHFKAENSNPVYQVQLVFDEDAKKSICG